MGDVCPIDKDVLRQNDLLRKYCEHAITVKISSDVNSDAITYSQKFRCGKVYCFSETAAVYGQTDTDNASSQLNDSSAGPDDDEDEDDTPLLANVSGMKCRNT
ncbi:MAG: hypothetical protein GY826_14130 [Fuerstiella sp.]|nr:hypothetical protein [Fuerstiella sp.]